MSAGRCGAARSPTGRPAGRSGWLAPLYFAYVEGRDPGESVASLTTEHSAARLAREAIPEHVMIINFLGVPLSGQKPGLRSSATA